MPLLAIPAVALTIRVLIQAVVQFGIFMGLDAILSPLIDKAKAAIAEHYDMTPEEAEDTLANEFIDALAFIGITAISIKTKLPTRAAEKLGFTSKGYYKRQISGKLPTGAGATVAKTVSAKVSTAVLTQTEAVSAIGIAKTTVKGAGVALGFLEKRLNTIFLAFLVVGGWIDFGNWETGAYAQTMQKVISFVTFGLLQPDEDWRKSKVSSEDVFGKVFNSYTLSGAIGIRDPFKQQTVLFTRDNMLDLVDQVGAGLLLTTGSASTKNILTATTAMIIFSPDAGANIPNYTTQSSSTNTVATPAITTGSKVFTGIISSGVLGTSPTFTARPDDLIESIAELEEAASNNLSAYLATVLSKIVYEVKIVSSIITKDGFKQTGISQQVQSGTYANGTPKYKTVTNKFATLNLYAVTDKGSRAKLTTVVLGPTNTAKLILGNNDIQAIQTKLPSLVTTTKISDIQAVETSEGIVSTPSVPTSVTPVPTPSTAVSGQPATPVPAQTPVATVSGAFATTLSGWYSEQGQGLPSISARATLYAELGLGQSSYYTGTAEQNGKLLAALKVKSMTPATVQPSASSYGKSTTTTKSTTPTTSKAGDQLTSSQSKALEAQIKKASDMLATIVKQRATTAKK